MKKYLEILKRVPLFSGMEDDALLLALSCLHAQPAAYQKGEYIWHEGDEVRSFGIVLSGSVQIVRDDYWGNRMILAQMESADLFGETFAITETVSAVSTLAARDCEILLIDCRAMLQPREGKCAFHDPLIFNVIRILAQKNRLLAQKIEHITRKTTREKLLSYLSECARKEGRDTFLIPFNRQELADYLAVDRSAMSSELSKLQREGVLEFHKNRFRLISPSRS